MAETDPRKPFGINISLGRTNKNREVTVVNITKNEVFPKVVIANNEGFVGIDCANFTTKYADGDVIRFSLNGVSDGQVDVTITSGKTASITAALSLTTRTDTGAL